MKLIAFYLPQYYSIPENDEWWGSGFTEWTHIKGPNAKPLFNGHYQPQEPYNDNYYNLLDSETRKWQEELANKYGIYGFCYYHYWFKGKKILEKPIELNYESEDSNIPYCFSWANESWTRRWERSKQILIQQDYGNENDWEEHFYYLLKFFKDKRYIRVNNKPIFIIYKSEEIKDCEEMLALWNKLATENGLDGIYFIETLSFYSFDKRNIKHFEAKLEFEPGYTLHKLPMHSKIFIYVRNVLKIFINRVFKTHFKILLNTYDYDATWNKILTRSYAGEKHYLGAFAAWDNTPRCGFSATIFNNSSPDKFEQYLKRQIIRSKNFYNNDEFIFINAWNEWGEGAYLEPDKKYGYACLEAIKRALGECENTPPYK